MNRKHVILIGGYIGAICIALGGLFAYASRECECFWPGVPVGFLMVILLGVVTYVAARLRSRRGQPPAITQGASESR